VQQPVLVQASAMLAEAPLSEEMDLHGPLEMEAADKTENLLECLAWGALAPAQGAAHSPDRPGKLPEVRGPGFHQIAAARLHFPTSSA